jgi:hypothetical protein
MFFKCQARTFLSIISSIMLMSSGVAISLNRPLEAVQLAQNNENQTKEAENEIDKAPANDNRANTLPTADQLIEAKLSALKEKQEEQEKLLAELELQLAKNAGTFKKTFDNTAYLSLSIKNFAPVNEYKLLSTEISVDGRILAKGGKNNLGLPRNQELFFGGIEPGCHDITIKARYLRLKNNLINRFRVNRVEEIISSQAFIAHNGYRIDIEIEGFEQQNTFLNFFRGPMVRFNKSIQPNFLPGSALVSLDEIFDQGRVHIEYITEDASNHRLIEKNLSIDGLPILVKEKHDVMRQKNIVLDHAPITEGKHRLNVTLVFGEKKSVGGGPKYDFILKFDRDFFVINGQTTIIELAGMPKGGIRSTPLRSRYAKVTSKIISQEDKDFFPERTCQEIAVEQKKLQEQVLSQTKTKTSTLNSQPAKEQSFKSFENNDNGAIKLSESPIDKNILGKKINEKFINQIAKEE